jgi:hypothetical protein
MQQTDVPIKFNHPFASGADPANVALVPDTTTTAGRAAMISGFDPANFQPVGAGGIPPYGQDIAGLFLQSTSWNRWQAVGGPIVYDATFQLVVGGYPSGAEILLNGNPTKHAISLVDNNMQDPSASGQTQWAVFGVLQPTSWRSFGANGKMNNVQNITMPNGYDSVEVILVGPGGAGASSLGQNMSGAGGGAGGYVHAFWTIPNNSICTFTAGSGAFADASGTGNSSGTSFSIGNINYAIATSGASPTFASQAICAGGAGGTTSLPVSPSSGLIVQNGADGTDGQLGSSSSAGLIFAGDGADGPWGGRGKAGFHGGGGAAGFGAGGGGSYSNNLADGVYYGGFGGPGIFLFRFLQFT